MKISVLGCGRWGSFIAWYQATVLKNSVISWGPEGDYSYEILKNTGKNDYVTLDKSITLTCDLQYAVENADVIIISISSQGALKEMRLPCIFCILFPLVTGFIFGPMFVGGVLVGATVTAIMLALFCGNAGGAWDNAKKYIEAGGVEGEKKGSLAHDASVVGDTVGDPLKDTVGPSLDILIKIMSTVSLVAVVVFSNYNLFGVLGLA